MPDCQVASDLPMLKQWPRLLRCVLKDCIGLGRSGNTNPNSNNRVSSVDEIVSASSEKGGERERERERES